MHGAFPITDHMRRMEISQRILRFETVVSAEEMEAAVINLSAATASVNPFISDQPPISAVMAKRVPRTRRTVITAIDVGI